MAIVCSWCADGLCDPPKSSCSMPGTCSCECRNYASRLMARAMNPIEQTVKSDYQFELDGNEDTGWPGDDE